MPFKNFVLRRSERSHGSSTAPSNYQVSTTSELQIFPATIGKGQNYAIQVLYDGREATVDIVFVHGLTGNSYDTWLHKEGNVHWPSQFLRQKIPDARILSFGYDADIAHFWGQASNNTLINHAEALIGDLVRFREDTGTETRPIIFVAHSLGGLVVEHALVHSNDSMGDHLKKIEYFTLGVIFLGVPLYGSSVAKWGELASQLTKLVKRTNTDILRVLKPDSKWLLMIQKKFSTLLRLREREGYEISVTCFYEELAVTGIGPIVPQHSAEMISYESYGIHADHMGMTKFSAPTDPGYIRITGELQRWKKRASRVSGGRPIPDQNAETIWMVPRVVNPLYTGRQEIGNRLSRIFHLDPCSATNCRRTFVIVGMGGIGKSEIALKFAEVHQRNYWAVFWLNASDSNTIKQGYVRIGQLCGVSEPNIETVKPWLSQRSKPWLLIFDNADNKETDYCDYLPSGPTGDVIITTRNKDCIRYETVGHEELGGLEVRSAQTLVLKAAGVHETQWSENKEVAQAITAMLDSHTLAILQAGAYIRRKQCSLMNYPQIFRQRRSELLKENHSDQMKARYSSVHATFEISAEYLQFCKTQEGSDALDLLHTLAFWHNVGISEMIFRRASEYAFELQGENDRDVWDISEGIVERLPGYFQWKQSDYRSSLRWRRACWELESLSIITTQEDNDIISISIHPLIHAWAQERQNSQTQRRLWQSAAAILVLSHQGRWDFDTYLYLTQSHLRACTRHPVEEYTQHMIDEEVAQILLPLAQTFLTLVDKASFIDIVGIIKSRLQRKLKNHHEFTDEIWVLMGYSLEMQNKPKEALPIHIRNLQRCRETRPDDKHRILCSQHALACAYTDADQAEQAILLLENVQRSLGTHFIKDDPNSLTWQHELARAYYKNRQFKKAISLYEHIVEIEARVLAEVHRDRIISQHGLAYAYLEDKQIEKAISLFEHVVEIEARVLAEEDYVRLISQHGLAYAYLEDKQIDRAISLFEYMVKIRGKFLTEDNSSRLTLEHELAVAYRQNGQAEKAIRLLELVVEIRKNNLAEEHPDRLASEHELAVAYRKNGQAKKSIQLLEHVVKVDGRLGDDSSRITSQVELIKCYNANGQGRAAKELSRDLARLKKRLSDKDHC